MNWQIGSIPDIQPALAQEQSWSSFTEAVLSAYSDIRHFPSETQEGFIKGILQRDGTNENFFITYRHTDSTNIEIIMFLALEFSPNKRSVQIQAFGFSGDEHDKEMQACFKELISKVIRFTGRYAPTSFRNLRTMERVSNPIFKPGTPFSALLEERGFKLIAKGVYNYFLAPEDRRS